MPKKPSTLLKMQPYPPLSSRCYHELELQAIHREGRAAVRFTFGVRNDDRQAGRTVAHTLPAVLTPNSPLAQLLAEGFRVHLSEDQSFDLAALIGRHVLARFDKGANGHLQAIVAIRACPEDNEPTEPGSKTTKQGEQNNGLG